MHSYLLYINRRHLAQESRLLLAVSLVFHPPWGEILLQEPLTVHMLAPPVCSSCSLFTAYLLWHSHMCLSVLRGVIAMACHDTVATCTWFTCTRFCIDRLISNYFLNAMYDIHMQTVQHVAGNNFLDFCCFLYSDEGPKHIYLN
jgi:hypothetical protein